MSWWRLPYPRNNKHESECIKTENYVLKFVAKKCLKRVSVDMKELSHSNVTGEVLGAAFEVHRVLGAGFLEKVYEAALIHELQLRGMQVQNQIPVPIHFKSILVGTHILDLLIEDSVIVELKAVKELADIHTAVVLSYLAATHLTVGLLLNFGKPSLEFKRIVR
jgi:GxxExxY protein